MKVGAGHETRGFLLTCCIPGVGRPLQFSADVLACNLRPDGEVEVLDTWNPDQGRGNVRDDVDDTYMFASSVVDGRIKCL